MIMARSVVSICPRVRRCKFSTPNKTQSYEKEKVRIDLSSNDFWVVCVVVAGGFGGAEGSMFSFSPLYIGYFFKKHGILITARCFMIS